MDVMVEERIRERESRIMVEGGVVTSRGYLEALSCGGSQRLTSSLGPRLSSCG